MIIKVCGMRDAQNIKALDATGLVDWMGFIFYPPSPRHVATLPSYMPHRSKRVGVFVNADIPTIQQHQAHYRLDIIQLHGSETADYCHALRQQLTSGTKIIKTIPIAATADLAAADTYQTTADYLLFETKTTTYGGSGTQFDWNILREYAGILPYLITGGIGPDDTEALRPILSPPHNEHWKNCIGLDLNSKFELELALKDIKALQTFITTIKQYEQNK